MTVSNCLEEPLEAFLDAEGTFRRRLAFLLEARHGECEPIQAAVTSEPTLRNDGALEVRLQNVNVQVDRNRRLLEAVTATLVDCTEHRRLQLTCLKALLECIMWLAREEEKTLRARQRPGCLMDWSPKPKSR